VIGLWPADSVQGIDRPYDISDPSEVDRDEIRHAPSPQLALTGLLQQEILAVSHRRVLTAARRSGDPIVQQEQGRGDGASVGLARQARRVWLRKGVSEA
jgi:hypothetical protein